MAPTTAVSVYVYLTGRSLYDLQVSEKFNAFVIVILIGCLVEHILVVLVKIVTIPCVQKEIQICT